MRTLLVVAVITLALFSSSLPDHKEIDCLIEELEYCMEIHEWYIENDYYRNLTGSEEWHNRWVDTYNRTIIMLRDYRGVFGWMK